MYCKSCGEMIIGNEKVCPKCGESVHSGLDIPENQLEDEEAYTYVKPKSKFTIFVEKLYEVVGGILSIAIIILLIWYFQIWPHNVYKVGCNYLEDKVFTSETEYKFKKYDKKYITSNKDREMLNLGDGKMSYHHFYLIIPVTLHSDEMGDVDLVYKMDIFVHPFGEGGVFKKSRVVRCSGQPIWLEETKKSADKFLEDMDSNDYETTSWWQSSDNDDDDTDDTSIEPLDLSGRYEGIDNNDIMVRNR